MAGHSKYANIKHRKAGQDAKREKQFTKLMRAVRVAVEMGGTDPDTNARLRDAITRAKSGNVPKDRIERALKDQDDGVRYEAVLYEGYGPGGTAILMECLTDNRNRTAAEIRHALSRHGGNLGTAGSVSYLFERCSILIFGSDEDEDAILGVALDVGAQDVQRKSDGMIVVKSAYEQHHAVESAMKAAHYNPVSSDVVMVGTTTVSLNEQDQQKLEALLDVLEDLDDVQHVYVNVHP